MNIRTTLDRRIVCLNIWTTHKWRIVRSNIRTTQILRIVCMNIQTTHKWKVVCIHTSNNRNVWLGNLLLRKCSIFNQWFFAENIEMMQQRAFLKSFWNCKEKC